MRRFPHYGGVGESDEGDGAKEEDGGWIVGESRHCPIKQVIPDFNIGRSNPRSYLLKIRDLGIEIVLAYAIAKTGKKNENGSRGHDAPSRISPPISTFPCLQCEFAVRWLSCFLRGEHETHRKNEANPVGSQQKSPLSRLQDRSASSFRYCYRNRSHD